MDQAEAVEGQATGQDRDDSERDREVAETTHVAEQLLRITHLMQPVRIGTDLLLLRRCRHAYAFLCPSKIRSPNSGCSYLMLGPTQSQGTVGLNNNLRLKEQAERG